MLIQESGLILLNYVPIKAEISVIDPGTVHAIRTGTLILETRAELRYYVSRSHDYDRLQDDVSLRLASSTESEVIDYAQDAQHRTVREMTAQYQLMSCKYFSVEKYEIHE